MQEVSQSASPLPLNGTRQNSASAGDRTPKRISEYQLVAAIS